jgi:hypothetical protein
MKSHASSLPKATGLLSVNAAADWLGVSVSWLNKSRGIGEGPRYIKIGSRVLYDPEDLRDYAARQRRSVTMMRPR